MKKISLIAFSCAVSAAAFAVQPTDFSSARLMVAVAPSAHFSQLANLYGKNTKVLVKLSAVSPVNPTNLNSLGENILGEVNDSLINSFESIKDLSLFNFAMNPAALPGNITFSFAIRNLDNPGKIYYQCTKSVYVNQFTPTINFQIRLNSVMSQTCSIVTEATM